MLFSSITFLFYFLPAVLVLYFMVPAKGKNLVLLIFSLLVGTGRGEEDKLSKNFPWLLVVVCFSKFSSLGGGC